MSDEAQSPSHNGTTNARKEPGVEETGFEFSDDPKIQNRNTWRFVTGGLTAEGILQYVRDRDDRNEKEDCARCEKQRDYVLQYSPIVRFLNGKISALGGDLNGNNIQCRKCEASRGGGFTQNYGILLCANRREPIEDVLAHEMVHAYDFLRFKVDFEKHNLRHAACTEIRASSLSGECRFWREFWNRGQWKLMNQHQECVKRRAVLSVAARPTCKNDVEAARAVNEVWDSCFADTRPFDSIYK